LKREELPVLRLDRRAELLQRRALARGTEGWPDRHAADLWADHVIEFMSVALVPQGLPWRSLSAAHATP
jgi:hypothetical protein